MNSYSLLDHLAPSFSSQRENLSTEALLYLLHGYENARRAFVSLVSDMGTPLPNDLTFTSQQRMHNDKGIPDLAGQTSNGESVLLVEAKFWAPLTKNQPVGYLRRLPKNEMGILVFVAPERSQEELWQSLTLRCQEAGMNLTGKVNDPSGWCKATVSETGTLAIISWSFLLDYVTRRLDEAGDTEGVYEVWQLKGLCRRLEEPFRLSGASFGSEERKAQLKLLTNEVSGRLSEAGVFATKGYRATPGANFYRRFGDLAGLMNWSIGFDEALAEQLEESLIWIRGPQNDEWSKNPPKIPQGTGLRYLKSKDGRPLFPLDVHEGKAREVILQSLFDQAMSVVKLLEEREGHQNVT